MMLPPLWTIDDLLNVVRYKHFSISQDGVCKLRINFKISFLASSATSSKVLGLPYNEFRS